MAAPSTTVELLEQVRTLGVCDPSKLTDRFPTDTPLPDSPTEFVKRLVRDGVCTKYQGRMILAGKARKLVLGKYRLLKPLGRGGAGSVFLGEHTAIRRRVAVKVLRGGAAADPLALTRFQREARAAAALDHPNIIRLFDFGVSHGVPYLVMEFVPGVTVQQLLESNGPLDVPTAVHIVTQTALGLAHAHARGFVHRDIKPLNLMATPDGGVKILDMGLARALTNRDDHLTEQAGESVICGTLDYLSPEQCGGGVLDGRTDVYSLGVTLFTLLTGRPPFLGTPAEKIAQHQNAAPPSVAQLVPGLPDELSRVVDRMLAKSPADRLPSCDAVVQALAPWRPAVAPTPAVTDVQKTLCIRGPRATAGEWSEAASRRRVRRKRLVLAAVALALIGVTGLAFALSGSPPPPTAAEGWQSLELTGHAAVVNELAFTPDGRRLYGFDWAGCLTVWDTSTGRVIDSWQLEPQPDELHPEGYCMALTPCGRVLAGGKGLPTQLWDPAEGRRAAEYEAPPNLTWGVAASTDGRRVVANTETAVKSFDLSGGAWLRTYDSGLDHIWSVAISPDGSKVAVAGRGGPNGAGTAVLFDAESGDELRRLSADGWDFRWVEFRADGREVATCGFDGDIRLWNPDTGACARTFSDPNVFVERVRYLPDGRLLTVAAPDYKLAARGSSVAVWDPAGEGELPVWTTTVPGRANTVAFSPAAGLYAVANKSQQVWLTRMPPQMRGR